MREGPSLAGAGTGKQKQRALAVRDGLCLFGGQPLEQPDGLGKRGWDPGNWMCQTHHLLRVMSISWRAAPAPSPGDSYTRARGSKLAPVCVPPATQRPSSRGATSVRQVGQ